MLSFGKRNAKLGKDIATFSLPAGFTCPKAHECLSKSNRETGKIKDGKHTQFRCFSASAEALYPNVRKSRWNNFEQLKGKTVNDMVSLIDSSLPKHKIIRVHVSGDFFSQDYFAAWMKVARKNPDKLFYAYTKCLSTWVKYWLVKDIPENFILTASYGGKEDYLIKEFNLRSAIVVYSVKEAEEKGLKIDHDDSLARDKSVKSFALLIHGIQPKGKKQVNRIYGYGKRVPLQVV
jgi:hypothetical protein